MHQLSLHHLKRIWWFIVKVNLIVRMTGYKGTISFCRLAGSVGIFLVLISLLGLVHRDNLCNFMVCPWLASSYLENRKPVCKKSVDLMGSSPATKFSISLDYTNIIFKLTTNNLNKYAFQYYLLTSSLYPYQNKLIISFNKYIGGLIGWAWILLIMYLWSLYPKKLELLSVLVSFMPWDGKLVGLID